MSERFPTHKKFPLVLRLWKFGPEGTNTPIRSINKLNKLTRVSHITIRSWRDAGWLDLDMTVITKILNGEIKEEDLNVGENGKLDLDSFQSGSFEDGIKDAKEDKQSDAKEKTEDTDETLKNLLMSDDELKQHLKPDEDVRGRNTPRHVTISEFPASDMVFHDVDFYEKGPMAYHEKNHNEFMRDTLRRVRKIVDTSSSQLEGLVLGGRIGSKSALAAFTLVKDGLGVLSRHNKELFEDDATTKLSKEDRKARLDKQRKQTSDAIKKSQDESASNDELVATGSSRLNNFRKERKAELESPDLDGGDIDTEE